MSELSKTQDKLISDFYNLKKDFAIKLEEIQALYLENKNLHRYKSDTLDFSMHSYSSNIWLHGRH